MKMQYIATLWSGFVTSLWNDVLCEVLFWSDVMDGDTHTHTHTYIYIYIHTQLCDADLKPTILVSTH